MKNQIHNEDCLETIKRMPDNFIDLVVTSPPYEAMKSYGNSIQNKKENEWVDWMVEIFTQLKPKLKETASLIINVNAPTVNKCRSLTPQKLMIALSNIYFHYDEYIWAKKNGIPSGSQKRINNMHEYILHFTKTNNPKMNTASVLHQKTEGSKSRQKYKVNYRSKGTDENGLVVKSDKNKTIDGDKRIPFSYLHFNNTSVLKGKPQTKHPAPFHPDLPEFFIKMLTDEKDVVYDPFTGSGTTPMVSKSLRRNWIGSELNESYIPLIRESLESVVDLNELFT